MRSPSPLAPRVESRRGTVVAIRHRDGRLEPRFVPDDDQRLELSVSRLPKDNGSNYPQPTVDLSPYLGLAVTITGEFQLEGVFNVRTIRISYGRRRVLTVRSHGRIAGSAG